MTHRFDRLTPVRALCVLLLGLGAASPVTDVSNADKVLRATLPNGLRVVIVPDRLAPVVTTELNYLVGSNDAPDGFPGTAHALEHMMFRGSTGLDRDQLSELGAQLGGSYNADTTETVTQYFYTAPAEDLSVALHIEALRMNGLTLSQADWEKERGAIEQEVSRDNSSPIYKYLAQLQSIMFAGTPYEHDALGTRPSFDKTDAKLLRDFYERWYAPNNAILVVAGDVDPAAALEKVRAAFGAIPRRDIPAHRTAPASPVVAKTLALPTDFPVGLVTLAFRTPGLTSHDFAAADILADVLSSQRGALYGLVPAGRALMSQFVYLAKADVGYAVAAAAFPKGGDPAPLLADVKNVLADAVKNGVSPELVAASKRQEIAQLAFKTDSIEGLAEAWSKALAFQHADSPDDVARAYAAVTVDDVNRLAREVLNPDHAVTAIMTPETSGKPVAGKGFGGAESFGGAPDKPVVLPDWASAALASLQIPKPATPPDVSVLPNGLRLIVVTEHVSPTVSVFGQVREVTEMEEKPGQEGVGSLTADLFSYGSESRDRLAFHKALDDIAASESAGPGFSLRILAPQFENGMRLLAENELHPGFPARAFPIVRRQAAQGLAGLLQSPDYLFKRAIEKSVLPAGDPALRQATPDTVMKLSLDDVKAYYSQAYRPDLTTVVVAGDVTPAEARRVVAENFGAWSANGPTPHIDLPPVGNNGPSQTHVPDSTSLQDSVTLGETLELLVSNPDRFTFSLGNTILSGGFSSHLFRDLRVKTGYVYNVDGSVEWNRTRSFFSVSYGSDPENVGRARALAVHDVQQMQTEKVTDAELIRAKSQMLRALPMHRASIDGIAGLYLRLIDLGLPLDTQDIAAHHYYAATADDIKKVFAKYVRPGDLAEVVKGPPVAQ